MQAGCGPKLTARTEVSQPLSINKGLIDNKCAMDAQRNGSRPHAMETNTSSMVASR